MAESSKYLPRRERRGIALCLSGGGFRATLFHLGALRRLNELGVLAQCGTITSVSGGSIINGVLAAAWERLAASLQDGRFSAFDELLARPVRAFCREDLRTRVIIWGRLDPREWGPLLRSDYSITDRLAKAYADGLDLDRRLSELPGAPRFIFCATNLETGANWEFQGGPRGRMGDWQVGQVGTGAITVAQAVAASSAFPFAFPPLILNFPDPSVFDGPAAKRNAESVRWIPLTDGGVYDNMGLEPVWKSHEYVLVSDAGAPFEVVDEPKRGAAGRLSRSFQIISNQSAALRKRWLIGGFQKDIFRGTYWGIGTDYAHYELPDARGYPVDVVERLKHVRTDLDSFTDGEIGVLENHGYALADAAIRKWTPGITSQLAQVESLWRPAPFRWPADGLAGPIQALAALKDSHQRGIIGDIWTSIVDYLDG